MRIEPQPDGSVLLELACEGDRIAVELDAKGWRQFAGMVRSILSPSK